MWAWGSYRQDFNEASSTGPGSQEEVSVNTSTIW